MADVKKKSSGSLRLNKKVLFRRYGNRGILVCTDSAKIIVVNEVGASILECIEKNIDEKQLICEISKRYCGDPVEIKKEVKKFLGELKRMKVLK